jgi:formylglycine-generating enzyme required for sulfatase activity
LKTIFWNLMVAALGALALTTATASAQSPATSPAPTNPASVVRPEMVHIPGQIFEAGKYEVTFAEWDACVAGGGCNGYTPSDEGWGRENRPVINVSWDDAQAYVQWLNQRTGLTYRLLTSAEWEIAARAGTTTDYSWGDQAPVCDQNARNGANFDACPDDRTRPVGSFPANGFSLHEVHGNVGEWVEDADGPTRRIFRDRGWGTIPYLLRSAFTNSGPPNTRISSLGFRLGRSTSFFAPEMVRIPGQTFEAGKYEVTFAEWDACVAGGGCNGYRPSDQGWGRGNRPVINVSWNDTLAYVRWLNQQTGLTYRLLTSAEWEIAARAGSAWDYSWGHPDPVCDQTAHNGANFRPCPELQTRPVGSFQPNALGLYDVHGNVWEWVQDTWSSSYGGSSYVSTFRVLRGGSWDSNPVTLRNTVIFGGRAVVGAWHRGSAFSSDAPLRDGSFGFRLARTL